MRVRVDDDLSSSLNQSDISLFARFCRINEGIPKPPAPLQQYNPGTKWGIHVLEDETAKF